MSLINPHLPAADGIYSTKLFCAFFSQEEFFQVSMTLLSKSKLKRFCEKSFTNTQLSVVSYTNYTLLTKFLEILFTIRFMWKLSLPFHGLKPPCILLSSLISWMVFFLYIQIFFTDFFLSFLQLVLHQYLFAESLWHGSIT